jgi:tRNA dimethylallyltransferase
MRGDPPTIVLVGPTAAGKTALLDAVFGTAERRASYGLPEAEIVSADSMQAYRLMDIGTAKPDRALRSRLPHSLIDIRNIDEQYTAGDFVRLADEACSRIAAAGKLPVVCGGTGFYARNFICGMPTAPAAEASLRAAVAADLASKGAALLRAELAAVDPEAAARIHANDFYRLTRALEITRATGRPTADFAAGKGPRPGRVFAVFCLEAPREELYARIGGRVDAMMAMGLPDEIEAIRRSGYGEDAPGMQAIGYREFFDPLSGGSPSGEAVDLRAIAEAIKRNTRRYAKRQMTFFRGLPGVEAIGDDPAAFAARIREARPSIVQSDASGL